MRIVAVGLMLIFTNWMFARETYTSEEAKFKITFPTDFEVDEEQQDGMKVISLSCTYQSMILLVSAFVYDEVIPEDEYALKVAEGILVTADAFNSKFVKKKCVPWEPETDVPGLVNPIKGKVEDGTGGKFKFFGNIYICMAYGIEYRITSLSTSKKGFDAGIDARFINSFGLL